MMWSPNSRWVHAITLLIFSLALSESSSARSPTISASSSSISSQSQSISQSNANGSPLTYPTPPSLPAASPNANAAASASTRTGGGNPITQLAGYVKNSFVQFKNGSVQLYSNHKQCNAIRTKQRSFIAAKHATMPANERRRAPKYFSTAGGISYAEFDFLQKGKDDRVKVLQLGFMMVYASRFVPYAFMFFPDMLPSPFRAGGAGSSPQSDERRLGAKGRWDTISRERTHAVVSTLLAIERDARVPPKLLKLNPFGHKGARKTMAKLEEVGQYGAALLATQGLTGVPGAGTIVEFLKDKIYTTPVNPGRWRGQDRTGIKEVPKVIVRGVARLIDAPHFNPVLPGFLLKGKVINHLQMLSDADEFLVSQDVDLDTLGGELLREACNRRLIGGPDRSDEALREGLASWLDLTVKEPTKVVGRTGLEYNANLARLSILCYHAVDGARDARATSYLPRLMYQGQFQYLRQARQEKEALVPDMNNNSGD